MIRGYSNYSEGEMVLFADWKSKIERIYERHGFTPFTMRPVEKLEDLTKKGGVNHQIFAINQVNNENDAKIGLPFDRTVPMALWINQYSNQLAFPLKRSDVSYSYRGEKAQTGRFRAFFQADIDIVDTKIDRLAEVECLATIYEALQALNIGSFTICMNNMKISRALAYSIPCLHDKMDKFLPIIDKLEKQPKEELIQEILQLDPQLDKGEVTRLFELFSYKGPLKDFKIPFSVSEEANQAINDLTELFNALEALGMNMDAILFCPCMVRGLNYYTGMVFETFLNGWRQFGSIASGGRYDNLLEGLGGKTPYEGIGGSIGLTRLFDICTKNEIAKLQSNTIADVMVSFRDPAHKMQALESVRLLRENGLKVDLYTGCADTIKKKLNYADRKNFPFVFLVMDVSSFLVKDMLNKGQNEYTSLVDAVASLTRSVEAKTKAVEHLSMTVP